MEYIQAFVLSFLLSLATTPVVIIFAKRFSIVDNPQKRKKTTQIHTGTIPRAGGLAIEASFLISSILLVAKNKLVFGVLAASVLAVIVGLLDDIKERSPYSRIIANIFTACIVVAGGAGIPFITNPFNGVIDLTQVSWQFSIPNFLSDKTGFQFSILPIADLAAILWIVWTMNIVGWSGGVDGQMPGFVAVSAVVIAILSFRFLAHDVSQTQVALLSFITAGAFVGFLPWNFYPQKIMPGYGGKSLAGLLLASLSILSGAKLGTAILVLSIPMADAAFTLFRRIISGKSPFQADKEHLHHKLLEQGWGRRRIAIFYWITTGLLGVLVLNLNSSMGKFFAAVLSITLVLMVLFWLHYITSKKGADNVCNK